MVRALAMVSGGLDSILAAKLIKDQGIEVIGVCFRSYFFDEENAKRMTKQIDIPLEVINFSDEHFKMVKNPKHGWGKNMNPCIDCHAMMMKYSGELLKKFNADFIITGEVLNQRPMSQNKKALGTVREESGFSNKILRPLCAKNLEETEMELNGLVDREKLLDISGRTRTAQIELAKLWNIKDYPSPAGGCRLTEPNYALRLKDLVENDKDANEKDLEGLKYGRHFRISEKCKAIVARSEDEEKEIKKYLNKDDLIFYSKNTSGAMLALKGIPDDEEIKIAAAICARYSKGKDQPKLEIKYGVDKEFDKFVEVTPFNDEDLKQYMIIV